MIRPPRGRSRRSSPTKSSGSLASRATAYDRQSPKLSAARCGSAAEAPVGINRLAPVRFAERHLGDVEPVEQLGDGRAGVGAQAGRQHDAQLGNRRRPDPGDGARRRQLAEDGLVARLAYHDGDKRRGIDDHAPSGPNPRTASSSAVVRRRPSSSAGTRGHTSRSRKRRMRPSRSSGSMRCAAPFTFGQGPRPPRSCLAGQPRHLVASRSTSAFLMFRATHRGYTNPPFWDQATCDSPPRDRP